MSDDISSYKALTTNTGVYKGKVRVWPFLVGTSLLSLFGGLVLVMMLVSLLVLDDGR